ncbi:hypothetical protein EVAR_61470_1 [Eumeta japonica]|uniref:Uncharacterized protein n=1 Tax=Eumeta variegata TaxID=151549 RepID=A0A4C1Z6R9_EUMVA|nr:hypothetical protein EVAR_61470_1 [Eumeta japonica]
MKKVDQGGGAQSELAGARARPRPNQHLPTDRITTPRQRNSIVLSPNSDFALDSDCDTADSDSDLGPILDYEFSLVPSHY